MNENKQDYTYIAAFLTLSCNLKCSYCINHSGMFKSRTHLKTKEWVVAFSKLQTRNDLPITLQGGEPTLYNGFYELMQSLPSTTKLDLLTNAQFNPQKFVQSVPKYLFDRPAPYAPIRISYHQETMQPYETIHKAQILQSAGFRVGLFSVRVPEYQEHYDWFAHECKLKGLDFRFKEYLSINSGTFKYPDAVCQEETQTVMCRTSELLIAPDGNIHRCHSDLYAGINPIGHILDPHLPPNKTFLKCDRFGACNFCDVKIKNDRFQVMGATSVEITGLDPA